MDSDYGYVNPNHDSSIPYLVFLVAPEPARTSPLALVIAASRSSVAALRDRNEPREVADGDEVEDNS